MMTETTGKIFLAEQRGVLDTKFYKRCLTFNFGGYDDEHKKAPEPLGFFNDEILGASGSLEYELKTGNVLVILPITGDLTCRERDHAETGVPVGELFVSGSSARQVTITNPNDAEVNFLAFSIASVSGNTMPSRSRFDLAGSRNTLFPVLEESVSDELHLKLSIGQFDGRVESLYQPAHNHRALFFFVLAGAFEAEGRLLHPRDGLLLWGADTAEIEALSAHATILALEF